MNQQELKTFLDEKVNLYNNKKFIETDPIQIPHLFSNKEDIEISGFLSATIAWGNRKMIIQNSHKLVNLMGNAPHDFVMSHNQKQLDNLNGFVHRTFNGLDFVTFIKGLNHIYKNHNGMEAIFSKDYKSDNLQQNITEFKKLFFQIEHQPRTQKHISDPSNNSAAKRINMFLRWMVRKDKHKVDLGIWKNIPPSLLSCPLDVHSGNVARKLGLLTRKQNDSKAITELDINLRKFDKHDPVKYDFALFGLGVFEGF